MAEKTIKMMKSKAGEISEVEGEHRITFVASSSNEDRDYEVVEIGTFRLPIKGGGEIRVDALPAEGATNIDIPLLTDHDLYSVNKVIGSVRKASYVNGELIFEAGLSSLPAAQAVYTLMKEKHLDNAFSIQFRDYDYNFDAKTCTGGEIVEVSVVTRGSNKDARVLSVKGIKGDDMDKARQYDEAIAEAKRITDELIAKRNQVFGTANGDGEEHYVPEAERATAPATEEQAQAPAEPEAPAEKEAEESQEAPVVEETPAEPVETEAQAEETPAEPAVEEQAPAVETNEQPTGDDMENIAKGLVKEPTAVAKQTSNGYLASKGAMRDFARKIASMKNESAENILKSWKADVAAKGISGDDILPSRLTQIFFKTWEDNGSILSTFRNIESNASAVYAFDGEGEGIRAKGHKKGEEKADQEVETIRRDLKQKIVYKKLPIDLQDLLDDQTGELLRFRAEELAARIANEIAVAAILGDGRNAGTPDYRIFDGTRGLFSMLADAKGNTDFQNAVAEEIQGVATDNLYDKVVKLGAKLDSANKDVIVILPKGAKAQLLLAKGSDGHYMFQPGTNLDETLGVTIYEIPEMANSGYDAIAYVRGQYAIYTSNEMIRSWFDGNRNIDYLMHEKSVAGSLYGSHVCAAYKTAA